MHHPALSVPGFHDAMRANILHLLGITFQRIHKTVLGSYLQLEGVELDKLVSIHLGRGTGTGRSTVHRAKDAGCGRQLLGAWCVGAGS